MMDGEQGNGPNEAVHLPVYARLPIGTSFFGDPHTEKVQGADQLGRMQQSTEHEEGDTPWARQHSVVLGCPCSVQVKYAGTTTCALNFGDGEEARQSPSPRIQFGTEFLGVSENVIDFDSLKSSPSSRTCSHQSHSHHSHCPTQIINKTQQLLRSNRDHG